MAGRILFKVAAELNVGTQMLVDVLHRKGHNHVTNSPNTRISDEEYDLLVREFAKDRNTKAAAEQITHRRREEHKQILHRPQQADQLAPSATPEDPDGSGASITADELRSKVVARQARRRAPGDAPVELPAVARPAPARPLGQEEPEPPAPLSPPPAEPAQPEAEKPQQIGLKVVGKISLEELNKNKPRPRGPEPDRRPPRPQEQGPRRDAPTPPPSDRRPDDRRPDDRRPYPNNDRRDDRRPPMGPNDRSGNRNPSELRRPDAPPPRIQPTAEKSQEAPRPEKPAGEEEKRMEVPRPEGIIRADAPQLGGLTVVGKVNLDDFDRKGNRTKKTDGPSDKRSSPPSTESRPAGTSSAESEEDKKRKRKRKRKRKANEAPSTSASPAKSPAGDKAGTAGKKPTKDKPTEKEVDQSIRTTLSQMGKGASRDRQRMRRAKRDEGAARRELLEQQADEDSRVLEVTEFITANEFANLIGVPVTEVITKSFMLGSMVSINQRLDAELMSILAEEYGYEVRFVDVTDSELDELEEEDDVEDLHPRAPIITVMGHVDHGKTTLLDFLRSSNVTSQEAGGITQHIGAYEVRLKTGNAVTFLDTPGHEAFTAMRARGAKVTDVVIIVIAADDAVMPQTREAINHAQAANVPMVFAINKMDKPGADSNRIKTQLSAMNILVEEWGGKYQSQEISALKGLNVDVLLEKVILESEILELKANPDRAAIGTVIESRLDKGRGNVATVLVQNGTLRVGDEIVAGIHYGKVRALINQNGERIQEAGPSKPVQVLGIGGQPTAGDRFYVFEEEGKAKEIGQRRSELFREQQLRQTSRLTLEEIGRRRALGNFKELNIIIRGDVDGSVEALAGALLKLSTEEVKVNIVLKAVGAITEADVNLAIISDAIVLAFNVRPNAQARNLAEREQVDIRTYSVIYDAINDVKDALEGLLSPEIKEEVGGTAEIREVFKITKVGNIGGCLVLSGKITRNDPVRVIREGVVVHEGKLASLKRFKDDAKEVISGMECGLMLADYQDIQVGDTIESFRRSEVRRKLA